MFLALPLSPPRISGETDIPAIPLSAYTSAGLFQANSSVPRTVQP